MTIPKGVRDDLGLTAGDHLSFVADGHGGYVVRPVRTSSSAEGICDRLVKPGRQATIEEIDRAVATAVTKRVARGGRGGARR